MPLFAVVALLCGLAGTASAAFNPQATETPYRDFLVWKTEASGLAASEIPGGIRDRGFDDYDFASGRPPWTLFDPLGLYEKAGGGVSNAWIDKSNAIQANPNRSFGDSMKAMCYGIGGCIGIIPEAITYSVRGARDGFAESKVEMAQKVESGEMHPAAAKMGQVGIDLVGEFSLVVFETVHAEPLMRTMDGNEETNANLSELAGTVIVTRGGPKGSPTPGGTTARGVKQQQGGIYEFPDQTAGGTPYVGQSGNLGSRLRQHEKAGRLQPGTETTTTVAGDKTAREVAEHRRIQEVTGGVPASKSEKVSNKVDPIGPKRQHLLEDTDTN